MGGGGVRAQHLGLALQEEAFVDEDADERGMDGGGGWWGGGSGGRGGQEQEGEGEQRWARASSPPPPLPSPRPPLSVSRAAHFFQSRPGSRLGTSQGYRICMVALVVSRALREKRVRVRDTRLAKRFW
jgi:hypothetical protein